MNSEHLKIVLYWGHSSHRHHPMVGMTARAFPPSAYCYIPLQRLWYRRTTTKDVSVGEIII
jgi:hypothetical protein